MESESLPERYVRCLHWNRRSRRCRRQRAGGRSCMEEFVSITAGGDPIIFAKLAEYQEQLGVVDLDIKYLLNQNTLAPGFVNRIALNARRGRQGCYAASTSVPTTGGGGEG